MTTVLIASDKFKGSLTAAEVAKAVGEGISQVRPDAVVVSLPVADGGDGTLAAALAAGYTLVPVTGYGPTGTPVETGYARQGDRAVVELADACGLALLDPARLAPMTASSRGVGEVIAAAIEAGCRDIVLGIGGSASTDGGAGMVRALGAKLASASGQPVADGGAALAAVDRIDLTGLTERTAGVRITVACDVDNPLTGATGAAAVYGPQKGADPEQVEELDAALAHWADVVAQSTGVDCRDRPGAGAAGGVGFAALALLGAELTSGIDLMLDLVDFAEQVSRADLVITGEGALDEQTLNGKAPAGVASAALRAGVPVVAVCGVNKLDPEPMTAAGIEAAYALLDLEPDVSKCLADPAPILSRLGARIATERLASA